MRARIPSAEACRSRRRMTRRWICRMLSLREITRSPSRSHFSGMGRGLGEGVLHSLSPSVSGEGPSRARATEVGGDGHGLRGLCREFKMPAQILPDASGSRWAVRRRISPDFQYRS